LPNFHQDVRQFFVDRKELYGTKLMEQIEQKLEALMQKHKDKEQQSNESDRSQTEEGGDEEGEEAFAPHKNLLQTIQTLKPILVPLMKTQAEADVVANYYIVEDLTAEPSIATVGTIVRRLAKGKFIA
jgi:hypothetical protein